MFFLDERFLLFLPLFIGLYWLAGERARNSVLLLGNFVWLCLFSPSTLVSLGAFTLAIVVPLARLTGEARKRGAQRAAWTYAWIGVAALIGAATFLRLKSYFLPGLVLSASPLVGQIFQWLGFSYFLLKGAHVLLSTASGVLPPNAGAIQLLQYVFFLPTLTSGPIYRFDTFSAQLAQPKRLGWDDVEEGLRRILVGMAKKVVAVPFLNWIFALLYGRKFYLVPPALVVFYALLYMDFSGYCDIAIGAGRLLGFQVPENFKNPFTSTTLTQFWRNWHATLGDWLRENVFIPLGGIRAKGWQLSAIVLFSMFLVGVWHGYSWPFILWGVYHGTLLLIENRLEVKPLRRHKTPRWQLGMRYAMVQAAIIIGLFAFVVGTQQP